MQPLDGEQPGSRAPAVVGVVLVVRGQAHGRDLQQSVLVGWVDRQDRWRGLVDDVVARYLDCGTWESAFARVAAVEEKGFRPGVVSVVQTFGDQAKA